MIVLLDLNYTLISNSQKKRSPFTKQIDGEVYHQWLVNLCQWHYTILITARPQKYMGQTIERIYQQTNWRPQEYYFNDLNLRPPLIKKSTLERFIFPAYGSDAEEAGYLALESNPKTRAMYETFGIPAHRATEELCKALLTR